LAAYRVEDLARDVRKALSLPASETLRRLSGRAVRYARRVRNRRRIPTLTDADLLAALAVPAASHQELVARRRASEPLVPASLQSRETARALSRSCPESLEPIVQAAGALAAGIFDLLGSGPQRLGATPDWHTDFKSGKRWDPAQYSLEIVQRPDRGEDIKVPWELSRLQHLPTLGIAAAVSGDRRFLAHAVGHLGSFVAANPVYRGVNWNCTMDVALRASEILAAEGYLRQAGDDRFWGELLKALLLHGRFIVHNLEDGPVRGNHYLSDLAGLYLCALGLSEFRESSGWRDFARRNLVAEMDRQVTEDGLDYEASLSYHAFVTEMFLFPALLAEQKHDPFPPSYRDKLGKMLEGVAVLIRPDGTLPQIGDNDDGRFLVFSQYHRSRRDWRPLMALGGYLFRRSDWLGLAADAWVEGAWVLGEPFLKWREAAAAPAGPRSFRCRAFPDAGIYQLGEGLVQMVVDAGGVGQGGNGGHAHNDTLSFDLYLFGREVLPDRGTGTYTPRLAERNRFRSTRSHNTIQVDGEEMNPFPEEPFRLIPADSPRVLRWRCRERYAYLRAEHSGYRRRLGVSHRRSILMNRRDGSFRIEDRLEGVGNHRFAASFHLAPGLTASQEEQGWMARDERGAPVLEFSWSRHPGPIRLHVEEDLHSPSYGVTRRAVAVRIEWEGGVPFRLRYVLTPRAAGEP
jgi:uncharacterized heparinase superfamily protein